MKVDSLNNIVNNKIKRESPLFSKLGKLQNVLKKCLDYDTHIDTTVLLKILNGNRTR